MSHPEEHIIDPLEEIGDLVGKTLDILGAPAEVPGNRMLSVGLDDVDLFAGSTQPRTSPPPAASPHAEYSAIEGPEPEAEEEPLSRLIDPIPDPAAPAPAQHEPLQSVDTAGLLEATKPMTNMHSEISSASPSLTMQHSHANGSPLPTGEFIKVTVKEGGRVESMNALGIKTSYVQYTVHTDSTVPGLIAQGLEVKRRFSDFDALHKHLRQEYRGYFVPPLPEKSFLQGRMAQDEFIRLRRADLQAFIKCLTGHPVMRDSEALKIFLLQPGELGRNPAWTYIVNPPAQLRQQKSGFQANYAALDGSDSGAGGVNASVATLKAGVNSWVSWMKASVAQIVPPKREFSEEEMSLRQAKELLQDLEKLLEIAVEAARSIVAHQEAVSTDVKELGRNFAMLSRFEEAVQARVGQYTPQGASAANRASDLNKMAYGTVKQHSVWKTLSLKTASSLITLHDYWVMVPEAIHALEAREASLSQLYLLQDELGAKQQAALQPVGAGAARPGPMSAPGGEKKLGVAILQLEEQIKAATAEYEMLKERNQTELARLHLEREVDFRRMMAHFARTQAELVHASAEMWTQLARQFD